MEVIYFILAQAFPDQLLKLVEALNDLDCVFVIHLDKKQSVKFFSSFFGKDLKKKIHFIKRRCSTEQGGFEVVQATLNGLKYINRRFKSADRVVLLNGKDYPMKSTDYIYSYFEERPDKIFIEYFPISINKLTEGKVIELPSHNKEQQDLKLYGGSFWMSLPISAIGIILYFLKNNRHFSTFFKKVPSPNESFFQTLLMNCGSETVQNNIINQNLLLVKWDEQHLNRSILNGQDIDLLNADDSLFAGEFDPELSFDVITFIDNNILKLGLDRYNSNVNKVNDTEVTKENVVLFLTDKWNKNVLKNYNQLQEVSRTDREVYLIYHNTKKRIPRVLKKLDPFIFDNSILQGLGYKPITTSLVPGSNHFPLLKFYLENPNYHYYWNIEDDVCYNGEWENFFDFFTNTPIDSDFLSCNVQDYNDQPSWYWWNTIAHPTKQIPQTLKVRSFNPIYRLSNRALKYLHEKLSEGWAGHHEIVIPTLLKNAGFLINDFGGKGKYVIPGCTNKFYIPPLNDEDLDFGTVRFRPFICKEEINKTFLYHPVKF